MRGQSSELAKREAVYRRVDGAHVASAFGGARNDDDATYRVLCFCWAKNIRCYQPVLGLDFDEFLKKALKGDSVAKGLIAIDDSCRRISEKAWLEENEKPEKCDDSVYVRFFV